MTTLRSNYFFDNLENIKTHYEELTPLIMGRTPRHWITPYSSLVDFCLLFSPIEEQTWMALRCFGQLPMYPQYPVGKYFLDFGNPALKIAIECDGKEFHLDKEKDNKRDDYLFKLGWKVFRISGADCNRIAEGYHDRFDCDESEQLYILNQYYQTIEGLIKAIAMFFFEYKDYSIFEDEIELAFNCLRDRISPIQSDAVVDELSEILYDLKSEYYNSKED